VHETLGRTWHRHFINQLILSESEDGYNGQLVGTRQPQKAVAAINEAHRTWLGQIALRYTAGKHHQTVAGPETGPHIQLVTTDKAET
jgi:hypothetical protein